MCVQKNFVKYNPGKSFEDLDPSNYSIENKGGLTAKLNYSIIEINVISPTITKEDADSKFKCVMDCWDCANLQKCAAEQNSLGNHVLDSTRATVQDKGCNLPHIVTDWVKAQFPKSKIFMNVTFNDRDGSRRKKVIDLYPCDTLNSIKKFAMQNGYRII
ncbi:MAG: hypothetical protein FWD33_00800 [Alphaproteobacteria bacterium]|nr:hypothetical protein [Alphaproteobacteria bacterium]